MPKEPAVIAFQGDVCIASGDLAGVALAAQKAAKRHQHQPILIFDAATSEPVEIDLRDTGAPRSSGTRQRVLRLHPPATRRADPAARNSALSPTR